MKPQYCTIKDEGNAGLFGDSYRACLASIFDINLEEVPFFSHTQIGGIDAERTREARWAVRDWVFRRFGLVAVEIPMFVRDVNLIPEEQRLSYSLGFLKDYFSGTNFIVVGIARYNPMKANSVVFNGGEIIHDPTGAGLVGPLTGRFPDCCFWVTTFSANL